MTVINHCSCPECRDAREQLRQAGRGESATRIAKLESILKEIVDMVDAQRLPIANLCLMSAIHGAPYNGPKWSDEIERAKALLEIKETPEGFIQLRNGDFIPLEFYQVFGNNLKVGMSGSLVDLVVNGVKKEPKMLSCLRVNGRLASETTSELIANLKPGDIVELQFSKIELKMNQS